MGEKAFQEGMLPLLKNSPRCGARLKLPKSAAKLSVVHPSLSAAAAAQSRLFGGTRCEAAPPLGGIQ